jgi:hypothetical protein
MRCLWFAFALVILAAWPGLTDDVLAEVTPGRHVLLFSDSSSLEERGQAREQLYRLNDRTFAEAGVEVVFAGSEGARHFSFDRKGRLMIRIFDADRRLARDYDLKKTRYSAVLIANTGEVLARFDKPVTGGDVATVLAAH